MNLATRVDQTDVDRIWPVAMLPATCTTGSVLYPGNDVELDVAVTEGVGEDHVANLCGETKKWGGGSIVLSTAVMYQHLLPRASHSFETYM